jgi:DNA sulfur modification protein DndB
MSSYWIKKDLEYYELLVSQIGIDARFQFLADILEGRSVPGLEIGVPAIRSKMAGVTAYTFAVSPEYLLKIAFVSHRARGKASDIDAYQRLLKKRRLKLTGSIVCSRMRIITRNCIGMQKRQKFECKQYYQK